MSGACLLRSALLVAGACVLAGLLGCTSPPGEVSGIITLRGQAPKLKGLEICLLTAKGRMIVAPVNEEGSYTATGVPAGRVQVGLVYTPAEEVKKRVRAGLPKPPMPGSPPPSAGPPAPNPIPARLRDPSTSDLSLEVEPGKNNVFNYDIQP